MSRKHEKRSTTSTMPPLPSLVRDHLLDAQSHQERYILLASLHNRAPNIQRDGDGDNDSTILPVTKSWSHGIGLRLGAFVGRAFSRPQDYATPGTERDHNNSHGYPKPFQVFVLDVPANGKITRLLISPDWILSDLCIPKVNNPTTAPTGNTGREPPLPLKSPQELRNSGSELYSWICNSFYPTDYPDTSNIQGLHELFQDYEFPTAFLAERTVGVTHSFGVQEDTIDAQTGTSCYSEFISPTRKAQTEDSWFHFLCKNIIFGHEQEIAEDRSWVTGGFFMKWHRAGPPPQQLGQTLPTGAAPLPAQTSNRITLVCFWGFIDIQIRLKKFLSNPQSISAALENPFVLYVVILDELFTLMNAVVWRIIKVFNGIENDIFDSVRGSTSTQLDFVTLHKLAKHINYLKESSDASLQIMISLQTAHEELLRSFGADPPAVFIATRRNLLYTEGLFRSLNLRLISVEKRLTNIINLAFNLVTQHDSRAFRKNSESMSTIAIMTLIFLPGTAVASIFGTDFFMVDSAGKLTLSKDFGIYWASAIPVTLFTLVCWYYWRKWHFQRLKAAILPREHITGTRGDTQKKAPLVWNL